MQKLLIVWLMSLSLHVYASFTHDPFDVHIGIVPWSSAEYNYIWSTEIKKHLAAHCINSRFSSASDFQAFIEKSIKREFDVLVVPPHIGSFLINDHDMQALAIERWEAEILALSLVGSNIREWNDIKGKNIALPDELSYVSIVMYPKVVSHSVHIDYYTSHNRVFSMLLKEKVDVVAVLSPIYDSLQSILKNKIKVVERLAFPLDGVLLSSGTLQKNKVDKVFHALSLFSNVDLTHKELWQTWTPIEDGELLDFHQDQEKNVTELKTRLSESMR